MLNEGACRHARRRFTDPSKLAYARIGLAVGQPPWFNREGNLTGRPGREAPRRLIRALQSARNRGQMFQEPPSSA